MAEQEAQQPHNGLLHIEPLAEQHLLALRGFVNGLSDFDLTFIKEDLDEATLLSWVRGQARGKRWVAKSADTGDAILGLVALVPKVGWSTHVGELRVVVLPERRGLGVGTALTRQATQQAVEMGIAKLVVEVVAGQEPAIGLFRALGFVPEALLTGYIRDRSGQVQDLAVLAHDVDDNWSGMAAVGVEDAVG
jgi:ribosomal protein S18 acetylase RimI-like enzyme